MRAVATTVTAILLGLGSALAADLPGPGAPFPEWKLTDHRGAAVSSAGLAGSTYLLWFYPKAMTPGCTVEGGAFRDRHGSFVERGVKVYGVSFDPPADNAEFVEREGFPFDLLSDEQRRLGKAVGASPPLGGYARRVSFLVGPDGRVLRSYQEVDPASHADQVLRDLDAGATQP